MSQTNGRSMRKIKKLKRISIMLLCAVLLHGGCGSRTTEETEKVDTTENFDLIGTEGWEYQGEKKQYIYGEWTVTGVRKGDTWDETDERVGAVYELLPESCSYKSSTESYSLKLEGYSASLISAREYDIAGMLPQDTNYCLEFSEVEMGRKYGGIKSAFTVLILIGENEIIGREDGNWCRLEKTTDYNDMPEGKDFLIPISGIWNGEWEVTEILKEDGDDAEQYIGADFSTWFQEILEEKFCNFYIVSTREPSIKQLVKAMGLEKETFVGFYEFSDDFYWDKMIVKDEMTAVLVKDGNYLWARRTSKRDQYGVYLDAYMEDYLNDGDLMRTEATNEEKVHQEQDAENMDGWENKGKRQQYIWGVWQITGIREGDTWDETDELVGAVYEMLPESCSYKSKTWSYTIELGGYEASPIVRWFEYNIGNMLPTPAGYYLSFGEVKPGEEYARSRSAFSPCILTDEKEMLAFWGRKVYRMEKVVDYDDIVEGKDFFRADYGLWSGEWVVTEVLKSEQHDAEEYIGMNFSTMEDNEICDFYLVDIGEKSIEKLVEAMGLENEFCVVFYEFSEDCFWDKMILKDEMTVVLVKDNNYFWAKRMSEKDPAGLYGSYF